MPTHPDGAPKNRTNRYEIGGLRIRIDAPPDCEEGNLAVFRTEDCQDPELWLTVRPESALRFPEGLRFTALGMAETVDAEGLRTRYCHLGKTGDPLWLVTERSASSLLALVAPKRPEKNAASERFNGYSLLRFLSLSERLLRRGMPILHASFVIWHGEALLFTAPKQTGKSTQAELWRQHRDALIVNGDRALLRKLDGRWTACGVPFSGSSPYCLNRSAPIRAVVILRQAPENRVARAAPEEILPAFLGGCDYDHASPEDVNTILELAQDIAAAVPIFTMRCLPDETAVDCLERALEQETTYVR